MTEPIPVAFYAPLKSPHHPSPSGDRTMARLLVKALTAADFAPALASTLRTFDGAGDRSIQDQLRRESEQEADRLIALYRDRAVGRGPRLWFTYHVYYKAPDWIGPRIADALKIPYVIAEGSRAGKRAGGPWALGHQGAEAALDRADAIFVMTGADREALQPAKPAAQQLIDLAPFIDLEEWPSVASRKTECSDSRRSEHDQIAMLTVAMMRRGDKLASYRILTDALALITEAHWNLDIVGDGEARTEVERLFSPFGPRVRFHGEIDDRTRLARLFRQADLFVWPAVNEAYGMVLLEAQAFGCPIIAGAYGGVASVVRDGDTGVLAPPGDVTAFANAVRELVQDSGRRRALGVAARRFVAEERALRQAAERLADALMPLVVREERR